MKKFLLGAVGLVASGLAAPASAADLEAHPYAKAPTPMMAAMYDWSGFYLGLNGGGGWSHKCWDVTGNGNTVVAPFREGCHNATGGIVGGQIGYRWQSAAWVFGIEAQGDWANLKGSNVSAFPAFTGLTDQTKVNGLGLFTGQVGYSWNTVLWYLKGGAGLATDRYSGISTATSVIIDTANETRWGGAVGTGLEVSIAPNWSVAAEYDHMFLGNRSMGLFATGTTAPAGTLLRTDNIRQDVDMVTARINYRWGGPIIAKY